MKGRHDDHPMAFILGVYCLHSDLVQKLFDVTEYYTSDLGHTIPLKVRAPWLEATDISPDVTYVSETEMEDEIVHISNIDFRKKVKKTEEIPEALSEEDDLADFLYELNTGKVRDREKNNAAREQVEFKKPESDSVERYSGIIFSTDELLYE
jgi:hypothetical protein